MDTNITPATPTDYFVVNMETGKLELHFDKATYVALPDEDKKRIKSAFVWGRNAGCWISRCKYPNLYHPRQVAESLGLTDAGREGERLSFADQMALKAERADRRADRYERRADAAEKRGESLQAPIRGMHGDIAFFTQPNVNTSAGRAFTRKRERMWAAFESGFEEFRKSEYWQDRAKCARATANQKELQDKGFVMRRIREREADIRKLKASVEEYEGFVAAVDRGETPRDRYGFEIKRPRAALETQIGLWLERLEAKLDELGFYQTCLDALGGVQFSRDTLLTGDRVYIGRWKKPVRYLRGGPKNFTYEFLEPHMVYADGTPLQGKAAYAEIVRVLRQSESDPDNWIAV